MTAGAALSRDHVAGYNCSFVPVDSPRSFDETMYILMCGTGVGFSVEYKYVNKLPSVPESLEKSTTVITVEDSKQGWAKAYRELLALLWSGHIPAIDVSKLRPAGARLMTMGGRSSGPQPLINLFDFTIAKFKGATGRQLKPIEAHDIMCKIGEVVVVGGVRRSAMISLSMQNGSLYMTLSLESVESTMLQQRKHKQQSLEEEIQAFITERTLAQRLFFVPISFVIFQKSYYVKMIQRKILKRK